MFDLFSFLKPVEEPGPLAFLGMFEIPVWTFLMAAVGGLAVLVIVWVVGGIIGAFAGLVAGIVTSATIDHDAIIAEAEALAEEEATSVAIEKAGTPRPRDWFKTV